MVYSVNPKLYSVMSGMLCWRCARSSNRHTRISSVYGTVVTLSVEVVAGVVNVVAFLVGGEMLVVAHNLWSFSSLW